MNILIACSGFKANSLVAQPWNYVCKLAETWISMDHDVSVVTDSPNVKSVHEVAIRGISTYFLPKIWSIPFVSSTIDPRELGKIMKEKSCEVVYFYGDPFCGRYLSQFQHLKVPFVLHISSDLYFLNELKLSFKDILPLPPYLYFAGIPLTRKLIPYLNNEVIRAITTPNFAIKRRLVDSGVDSGKIDVLPTPSINEKKQQILPRSTTSGTSVNRPLSILYMGPSHPKRGTETLIRSMALLKDDFPQLRLVLLLRQASSSEYWTCFLRDLASRLRVEDRISFVSRGLNRNDLESYVLTSTAVILPFKYAEEEPSISIIEAMMWGKPVISTSVGGIKELIDKERGIVVLPARPDELARAIRFIAENPEAAESMGKRGREFVQSLPDWNEYAHKILAIFKHTIEQTK